MYSKLCRWASKRMEDAHGYPKGSSQRYCTINAVEKCVLLAIINNCLSTAVYVWLNRWWNGHYWIKLVIIFHEGSSHNFYSLPKNKIALPNAKKNTLRRSKPLLKQYIWTSKRVYEKSCMLSAFLAKMKQKQANDPICLISIKWGRKQLIWRGADANTFEISRLTKPKLYWLSNAFLFSPWLLIAFSGFFIFFH